MLIYLDTMLWNELCDQRPDPEVLIARLSKSGAAQLVLGTEAIYEMAKTFQMPSAKASERGQALFRYLKRFVDLAIPCVNMISDLLVYETRVAFSQNRNFSPFLSSENYQRMASEVQKLSVGNFDARADGLVAQRWMEAQETRQAVIKHVDSRPLLRERLKVITEKRLPEWINREARHSGRKILSEHLVRVGFSVPQKELTRTAKKLLSVRRYRIAHAIVRADLYLNWRTVVRGSIPKDVPDDLFHVVNASYSDVYATKEIAQGRYAPVVLLDTRVEVYKGKIPIHEWLVTLASGHLPAPEKTPL